MSLREFWKPYAKHGFHPDDKKMILSHSVLKWTADEAKSHDKTFDCEKNLHNLLHENLYPQPFIGNIEEASVFILTGNPGFAPSVYIDEHLNKNHMVDIEANLKGKGLGFFPFNTGSKGTGVAIYWDQCLKNIISLLSGDLSISHNDATKIVIQEVAVLEVLAYHSKINPGDWVYSLPSSQIVREFVHNTLLPRTKRRDALIYIWRGDSHWGLSADSKSIFMRPNPLSRYLPMPVQIAIAKFLELRIR